MDLAAARIVLGVTENSNWIVVRTNYRDLIRRHHPDMGADLADTGLRTVRTAQITEAFAAIVDARAADLEAARPDIAASSASERAQPVDEYVGPSFRHPTVGADDTRVVLLDAPVMDAFLALHEAFSLIGAVSYIDRLSLVLEAIVVPVPGQATSLLTWLDRTDDGLTQATICVESLGGHPPAPLDPLVDRLAQLLASPRPPVTSA